METQVGKNWGEYYHAGMSSKEAQAFKAGWAAANREAIDSIEKGAWPGGLPDTRGILAMLSRHEKEVETAVPDSFWVDLAEDMKDPKFRDAFETEVKRVREKNPPTSES